MSPTLPPATDVSLLPPRRFEQPAQTPTRLFPTIAAEFTVPSPGLNHLLTKGPGDRAVCLVFFASRVRKQQTTDSKAQISVLKPVSMISKPAGTPIVCAGP
jgi:hypothetical protein